MIRILIVEDEKSISDLIRINLTDAGYSCICAFDGMEAADLIENERFDLILLDGNLPDGDGFAVSREIRKESKVPIVFLTARDMDEDMIAGFENGADDYVTKPFNILELKARVRALLRRSQSGKNEREESRVTIGEITIDANERNTYKNGRVIDLTAREFDIVELMMHNPGRVYSRENLLNLIWGSDYTGDIRTVDVHIRRLREKLEDNPAQPEYVLTKWGVGYYFKA